eukprot:scaffold20082_cov21-Prasinocladus_malaysianus.AAC.1
MSDTSDRPLYAAEVFVFILLASCSPSEEAFANNQRSANTPSARANAAMRDVTADMTDGQSKASGSSTGRTNRGAGRGQAGSSHLTA